jgi:hypothetical protein
MHSPKRWELLPEATITKENAPKFPEGARVSLAQRDTIFWDYTRSILWERIFTSRSESEATSIASKEEFQEMKQAIEEVQEIGTSESFLINRRLKELQKWYEEQRNALDILSVIASGPASIQAQKNYEQAMASVNGSKPIRESFANPIDYLIANAAWNLSQRKSI